MERNPGDLTLRDLTTGKARFALTGHKALVTAAAFSRDSRLLATGSLDGVIKLWNVASGKAEATWTAHPGEAITGLALPGDGTMLLSAAGRPASMPVPGGGLRLPTCWAASMSSLRLDARSGRLIPAARLALFLPTKLRASVPGASLTPTRCGQPAFVRPTEAAKSPASRPLPATNSCRWFVAALGIDADVVIEILADRVVPETGLVGACNKITGIRAEREPNLLGNSRALWENGAHPERGNKPCTQNASS
jgi:hypothetical protein